jgi:hypothetical protein
MQWVLGAVSHTEFTSVTPKLKFLAIKTIRNRDEMLVPSRHGVKEPHSMTRHSKLNIKTDLCSVLVIILHTHRIHRRLYT